MYHSITFGPGQISLETGFMVGKNTWDDWYLIPSSRPLVSSPGAYSNYVQIPGRSGSIDFTNYLTTSPIYGDRNGSWEFIVDNDHASWVSIKDSIMDYLHGKKMKCVLEDDPLYAYTGRFSLNEWKSNPNYSVVVIDYVLEPYRQYIIQDGNWLWDPFNFDTDYTTYPERKL